MKEIFVFRFWTFSLLFILTSCQLFAQDTIFVINKKKILSQVIEINNRDVMYKKVPDVNGRTYHIDKKDLIKIVYSNGVADTFNMKLAKNSVKVQPAPVIKKYDPRASDFFRNHAFLNVTDLFFGVFTAGYERTMKSGRYSYLIPLSIGMGYMGLIESDYDQSNPMSSVFPMGAFYYKSKIFSTGIELNFFPQGQGTLKYFLGPALEYGQFRYYLYKGNENNPGTFTFKKSASPFITLMFKNGFLYQCSKKINFRTFLAMGFQNWSVNPFSTTSDNDYYYTDTNLDRFTFEVGITAGYKF